MVSYLVFVIAWTIEKIDYKITYGTLITKSTNCAKTIAQRSSGQKFFIFKYLKIDFFVKKLECVRTSKLIESKTKIKGISPLVALPIDREFEIESLRDIDSQWVPENLQHESIRCTRDIPTKVPSTKRFP